MNHSKRFWELAARCTEGFRKLNSRLRRCGESSLLGALSQQLIACDLLRQSDIATRLWR